jgi:putative sugar O-methyltransferase
MGLANLGAMLEEIRQAPPVVRPSRYWEYLNDLNLGQLAEDGFDEFKRTINRNYFQFQLADPRSPEFRAVARAWLRHPRPNVLHARLAEPPVMPPELAGSRRAVLYNKTYALYLALLWEYVNGRDRNRMLERLEEPLLGRPIYIDYRGRRVSEDLCNSVLEFTAITDAVPAAEPIRSVIELGAGYGRLAWVFLSALPRVRYLVVDIPPALAVAERYLGTMFGGRRIFEFRHFDTFDDVAEEFQAAEILFLTPNQLDLLPPQRADLFVNVSSLHEMRPDQIEHYFAAIQTHCSGCFYTKQWQRSINEYDGLVLTHDDYPVPAGWQVVFDRAHPVQVAFFEALYQLGEASAIAER